MVILFHAAVSAVQCVIS